MVLNGNKNFQVSRLIYTNSGLAILALASNAIHKLWKWQRNDRNLTGKVLYFLLVFQFHVFEGIFSPVVVISLSLLISDNKVVVSYRRLLV